MSRTIVIGAGLAGLVGALRIADAGGKVTVIATGAGSLQLGGATLDVLGYANERVDKPLEAFDELPLFHPYRALGPERVVGALEWLRERLPALDIRGDGEPNLLLATAVGALRPTAAAQASIAAGDLRSGGSVVFAGFPSVKDFVPQLVAANIAQAELSKRVRSASRCRPAASPTSHRWEWRARSTSRSREPRWLRRSAARSAVADGARVGLPAVLGANHHPEVYAGGLRRARRRGVRGADHPAVGARDPVCTGR